MKRPLIEEFFSGGTTLSQAMKKYEQTPELFNYAKALDRYIDQLQEQIIKLEMKDFNKVYEKGLQKEGVHE